MHLHKVSLVDKREVLLVTATGTVSRVFQHNMEDQMRIALKAHPTWKLIQVNTTHNDITSTYAQKVA